MKVQTQATCLTIAGSDSGGEAGIQADLQCFNHYQVIGLSAITAVTAQNPDKVLSLNPTSPQTLNDQLQSSNDFFQIDALKTGLIASAEQVEIISDFISTNKTPLVVDPLIKTTSGREILDHKALPLFEEDLLPQATFICPNIPEAEILSKKNIHDEKSIILAGQSLQELYQSHVFIKGGHSLTEPGTDYLFTDTQTFKLSTPKVDIKCSHGTGCRISASITANLAKGKTALESAINAKEYVLNCLLSPILTQNQQWIMPAKPTWQKQEFKIEEITK